MKRKLLLIAFGLALLVASFIYGAYGEDKITKETVVEVIPRVGPMIKIKDVIQLSTYLEIDGDILGEILGGKKDRQAIEDTYLTMAGLNSIAKVVAINFDRKLYELIEPLSYDMEEQKENLGVEIGEFLEFYENIIQGIPKNKNRFSTQSMFVLGHSKGSDGYEYLVTDSGKYKYKESYDYKKIFDNTLTFQNYEFHIEKESLLDTVVEALVYQDSIVYIKDMSTQEVTLKNVWFIQGEEDNIKFYAHGMIKEYELNSILSSKIENTIGDIYIKSGNVERIQLKPDIIHGKVLVAGEEYFEIEKYGKLHLSPEFKIYKIYGDIEQELTNNILVGYNTTDFIVAEGLIVAALIKEPIKAENIRVLLKTDNFKDIYHEEVKLTSSRGMKITIGDKEKNYQADETVTYNFNEYKNSERFIVESLSENGKIKINSIGRAQGNPEYRGRVEIASDEKGFIIINDVSIEEYLYSVVPSEMPSSFGLESLKVQAICARSYAHKHLFDNVYSAYGAHVDDSISYQVYNNINETENSIQAVKATYGQVLMYEGEVATAYYFSTSSGHTASIEEVWKNSEETSYLRGKLQTRYDMIDGEAVYVSSQFEKPMDFSVEDVFRDFLTLDSGDTTYDSTYPWYRWNVTMTYEDISKSINRQLGARYLGSPGNIQTLVSGSLTKNPVFESKPIDSVGTVKNITVVKREASGIVSELIIEGSKATIKVISEYNIRLLLSPNGIDVERNDKSKVSSLNMLPSAFFVMDKEKNSIHFIGGGYGHGVGVSQNGVKAMSDTGKTYEEILKHYYTGVELGFIYE